MITQRVSAARRLLVSGRVQGVGYRMWAAAAAERLGLSGWVRNRFDGRVELELEGPAEALDRFVVQARSGPPLAQVEEIAEAPAEPRGILGIRIEATV